MTTSLISFSGIASGIDSASLIKSLIERERSAREQPLQDKIDALTGTNSAFSELSSLLESLNTAASKFRVINGGALAKSASSSDETVASATASNSSMNGAYSVNVTQVAKSATFSFKSSAGAYSSSSSKISAGASFSDTVEVQIGDSADPVDTVNVNVNENTTLDQFVSDFNSQTSAAVASVVNVGTSTSPDYRVVINSNKTGVAEGKVSVTAGATLTARGAFNQNQIDDAKNAIFSISGIGTSIERATNSITDVIPGLTFNLRGSGSSTVSVGDDPDSTMQTIQDFVDAYNKVQSYIKDQDLVQKESEASDAMNVFGPFASTSIDENVLSSLRSAFSSASTTGRSVNTLADLGITTERDGSLKFDADTFNKAIAADPEAVRSITENLGETLSSVDGTIAQFTRYNGLIDQAENANLSQISALQKRIEEVEKSLSSQEDMLGQRFSRLESLMGRLNSQQSALSQILPR